LPSGSFLRGHHFQNGWQQNRQIINSSLQNNPRYHFSLKSEAIDNLTIVLAAILKMVAMNIDI
jgi:hypothetical protein